LKERSEVEVSIVAPVYGCSDSLNMLVSGVIDSMKSINCSKFEILLVNDASPDDTAVVLRELCKAYPLVKAVHLSRNFGQHAAIHAGLSLSKGHWIVVMDCDLQDRPDEIPALYRKALEGYDIVLARREQRQDIFIKRLLSNLFYKSLSYLTETTVDPSIANFGIYSRSSVDAVLAMGDYVRFFPTMVSWIGFKRTTINVQHAERKHGNSSYNFKKLLKLGINVILSFSDKPLRITVKIGFFVTATVLVLGIVMLYKYLNGQVSVTGYTSLILSIWFLGGLIISILGIVGLYLGRAFDQAKGRPTFLIREKIGFDDD
jgi:dolichol-phosphate mannosyltransferase